MESQGMMPKNHGKRLMLSRFKGAIAPRGMKPGGGDGEDGSEMPWGKEIVKK